MDDTVLQMLLSGILRWGGYFWMIWMGMMSSWVSVKWVSGDGANMEGSVWRRNGQGEPVEGAQCCRHVQNHKMINVCCAQSLNVCNLVKQWDETDTTKCSNSEFAKRIHPQVGRNGRVCVCVELETELIIRKLSCELTSETIVDKKPECCLEVSTWIFMWRWQCDFSKVLAV